MEVMDMNTIYTLGYSGIKPDKLLATAEQHNLLVVDVRYSPRSRQPEWTRKRLQELLGERYIHVPAFGNINYKSDGPIQLADPEAGKAVVVERLAQQPVLLLCACKDWHSCHRLAVATVLHEATGAAVVHWGVGDLPSDHSNQLSLWGTL
jgi:uncharacterized protein (DUF488 family)